ncbi:MAG: NAD(P)H-dependent flavin oxidoreductase [Sphingorhabdus sp.]
MDKVRTLINSLRLPVIAAPMFLVSNPALALACCRSGIVGSFSAHSTRTREGFSEWLADMETGLSDMRAQGLTPAPYAVNLVVHPTNQRAEGDLELCIAHKVPIILTSKGAPGDIFAQIHDYGGIIFHDVASARHAEKALAARADGLIAVCGGAGGHTGTVNPFALVNELRALTDKPIILAGAISTGRDILAARTMGADLCYMGTRFIATPESMAPDGYREMLVTASASDILFTAALDGAPANFLIPSLEASGIDVPALIRTPPGDIISAQEAKARYKSIWSAGHGVGAVTAILPASDIVDQLVQEYAAAKDAFSL